jgi:YVTN family beta-propeller protein
MPKHPVARSLSPVGRSLSPVALAALLAAGPLSAQARDYLYVENTLGGDVSVIDLATHKVVGTIPASVVGEHPDDIIANRDGTLLFLSRLDAEDVIAISTETEQVVWRVEVGGRPNHLTLSADERYLYVPLFDKGNLVVIDTETRKIVASPAVGFGAHGTWLSPDGKRVYVGSIGSDQLSVVTSGGDFKVERIIELPDGVRPFQLSPDERFAYVQLSRLHGFVVVDLAKDSIVRTVSLPILKPLPKPTFDKSHYVMNHGLGISPDAKYLVANASMSEFVAIYAHPGLELLGTVPVGHEPNWVVFSKDSKYAYVSNRRDGD